MRRLIPLVIILFVAVGGALLALNNLASPAQVAASLQAAATSAAGRPFTIAGPVHLSLGLAPHLEAEEVSLANPPGASRPAMATARRLDADLALLPLLTGAVVIEHATLTGLDLRLERLPDGTGNWQFGGGRAPLYGGGSSAAHAVLANLRRLHAEDAHVAFVPAPGAWLAWPVALDFPTLDWTADSDRALMHIAGAGARGGLDYTLKVQTGSLERLAGGPVGVLAGSWPLTADFAAAGATLHADGGFVHPDEGRAYDFRITANVPDLQSIAPLFPGRAIPPLREVNFTTRLTDGATGALRTENLSLHVAAADLGAYVPGLTLKNAVFSAPGPGQLAQANIDGTYQGATLRATGTLTQPDTAAPAAPIPVSVSAQIADTNLAAHGTVPPSWGGQGLDLSVSARTPDLAALSALAGRELPPAHDVSAEAHLGDAGFRLRGIALRDLKISSSLGDLSGNVTAAWSPVLDLAGTLQSTHLDLDALGLSAHRIAGLPVATGAPPASGDAGRLIPDTQLPFALLRGADADLALNATEVKAAGDTYRDLQLTLRSAEGRLALNPLRVTAPQGLLIGGFTVDASSDPPVVGLSLRSPGISAASLAAALGAPDEAGGNLQIDAQLAGSGSTPRAIAATLAGHVGLAMVDGHISDALVSDWLGPTLAAAGAPALPEGDSTIHCLALRADLRHGTGVFRALAIDTSQLVLDGNGTFNLGDETLSLHLRPQVLAGGTTVATPVTVSGTLADPHAALEAAMPGGRYGFTLSGRAGGRCYASLATARGGLPGPLPVASPAPAAALPARKPVDLLQGIIH